ncbi:MAG: GDYXXLXY domain-containing protein [Sedimenticola sp.]
MNKKMISLGLAAAILLQIGVLAVEYLGANHPLWTGQEVRLKTVPVDPRSLFRGNYAQLNYDISDITFNLPVDKSSLRTGEVVYVALKLAESGLHEYVDASLERPDSGLFIRGRIGSSRWRGNVGAYSVRYGIEAFFAPKDKALALERKLRSGAVAVVMIADNGRATLKEIIESTLPSE